MRNIILVICLLFIVAADAQDKRSFYEIRVYHFNDAAQLQKTAKFLEEAWIPAMHRQGVKHIGAFTPIGNDTALRKKLYLFIPLSSINAIHQLDDALLKDADYLAKGEGYLNAAYDQPTFARMETIVLRAFPDMPKYEKPSLKGNLSERIYELRSYEGATEKLYRKKVEMFNKGGEIPLFKRLGFNAVFYAEVLAGSSMPNLMYMTSFDNIEERNKHWKTFGDDPEWKRLFALPEYQHTVSKLDIILLHPTSYSDL